MIESMKVADVCRLLEEYAPLNCQESYDNSGLQLGNPTDEVSGLLLCLDVSEAVVDEALETGCSMIVSHHPLLFKGLKHITPSTEVERCVIKALKHDLAIYSCHTNLDSVPKGVSGKMCEKLGLTDCSLLAASEKESVGLGMVGSLPQALTELEFCQLVKQVFGTACLRTSPFNGRLIQRVALCGGSGAEFISQAISAGADAYLTADVKYHSFASVEQALLLVDAGHYETEQFTKELFLEILSEKCLTFAPQISKRETNPVKYV